MLKVLIADDEMLVRVGVKSTIEWEKYGFTVVAEACNGEDALKKIETFGPDILLTDIRMPKMDGLKLLQEIQKRGLPVETVIMSCYNEFDLVRTAMQYGACDYLLKLSLTPEELLEVLERVKKKVLSRPDSSEYTGLLDKNDLYDKLLRTLRSPGASSMQLDKLAQALGLQCSFEHASLLLLLSDPDFDGSIPGYPVPDGQTANMALNLLREYLLNRKAGDILLLDREPCLLFLILLHPGINASETAATVQARLYDYLHMEFSVGLLDEETFESERFTGLSRRIQELRDHRFLYGHGSFLLYSRPDSCAAADSRHQISVQTALSDFHGSADFPRIPSAIRELSEQMLAQNLSRKDCLQLFNAAFYRIASVFTPYGGNINGYYDFSRRNISDCISQLQYLSDAETLFHFFAQSAVSYLENCRRNWVSPDILSAITYIQTHLHLPVSLQDTADHIGMSAPYLSTLFKRETGESFTEYLTRLRMEKAQELLKDRNIYIYEICERIGYTDPNYFCKAFKKYTGMSPQAYRKKYGI